MLMFSRAQGGLSLLSYFILIGRFSLMQVLARGPGRKQVNILTVILEPDVAEMFPDSAAVNEALRFLIPITPFRIDSHRFHRSPLSVTNVCTKRLPIKPRRVS